MQDCGVRYTLRRRKKRGNGRRLVGSSSTSSPSSFRPSTPILLVFPGSFSLLRDPSPSISRPSSSKRLQAELTFSKLKTLSNRAQSSKLAPSLLPLLPSSLSLSLEHTHPPTEDAPPYLNPFSSLLPTLFPQNQSLLLPPSLLQPLLQLRSLHQPLPLRFLLPPQSHQIPILQILSHLHQPPRLLLDRFFLLQRRS